jgi:hypothetical protein
MYNKSSDNRENEKYSFIRRGEELIKADEKLQRILLLK